MKIGTTGWIHHKNSIGMELMNAENSEIQFSFNINPSEECDYLMATDSFSANGNFSKGVIHGPHIDFRNSDISNISTNPNIYMNFLSPWLKSLGDIIYPGKNTLALPFPVDVNRFQPAEKNGEPVIYFKRRDRSILDRFLEYRKCNNYKIFDYSAGYNEDDFKDFISKAPYCVWIGCHESQGFALQETLSCNTPVFVIDAKSLRDEVGVWDNWMPDIDLKATSASYFDSTCGITSDSLEFDTAFPDFINNIDTFRPRDFIMRTLSPKACIKKWVNKLS
jgi:hypothetical protein